MALDFDAHVLEIPGSDELPPERAYLRLLRKYGRKHSFLLESIYDPKSTPLAKKFSSLSMLCCDPLLIFQTKGNEGTFEGPLAQEIEEATGVRRRFITHDPLEELKRIINAIHLEAGVSRFSFGPVGYISYDYVRFLEKLPESLPDRLGLPESYFVIHRNAAIFDHAKKRIHFVSHARKGEESGIAEFSETILKGREAPLKAGGECGKPRSNVPFEKWGKGIEKAKEYIRSGDIFQVVLSRKFLVETARDPLAIYFDLRKINPSPYMFYLDLGDYQFFGASPEVHVRLTGDLIEARPIAGTRGLGEEAKREMLASEKERAEHTMLVDLARNDVGKVSEFGSVKVPELFTVEKYSHVQHMVSHVVGKKGKGVDGCDVFRATFPAGTVSGAPKVRAMEIIEELEGERRGPYAGCVGYFDVKGNMDACISIRAVLMRGRKAEVQAGAGIVLDSTPKGEWIETRRKANACMRAITGKEMADV